MRYDDNDLGWPQEQRQVLQHLLGEHYRNCYRANANGQLIGPIHRILKNFTTLEDKKPFFLKGFK
jgi:hypothetical protein